MAEPTAREYEALTTSLRDLTSTIKDLRTEMASTYARKDWVERIEKDVEQHGSYFRWLVQIVMGLVIVALLGTVLVQNGVVR